MKREKRSRYLSLVSSRWLLVAGGLLLVAGYWSLAATPAWAAQFSFNQTTASPIGLGNEFELQLTLDPQGQDLNAFSGTVTYPADALTLESIRDGGSFISLWVERPTLPPQCETGVCRVSWSGVVPGGYSSEPATVLSLLFRAHAPATVTVGLEQARALLNDGHGTAASVSVAPAVIAIQPAANSAVVAEATPDKAAPEPFTIYLSRTPALFNNQWFITFATQDKGSGLDHYEVSEISPRPLLGYGTVPVWQKAASPYLLRDQALRSVIEVKAVDRAGNVRLSTLSSLQPWQWYQDYAWWGIMGLSLLVALLVARYLWTKRVRPQH